MRLFWRNSPDGYARKPCQECCNTSIRLLSLVECKKRRYVFHKDLTFVVLACLTASLLLPLYTADNLSLYNPTGYGKGTILTEKEDFTLLNDKFEEVTDSLLLKTEKVYVFVLKEQPDRWKITI